MNTQAGSPETVPSRRRLAGSCSRWFLGTWSSPSGRRWARALNPLSCTQPVGPAEPYGSAASRPQLRACRGLCGLCVRGLPTPCQRGGPQRPGRTPGPCRGGGWGGRRDEELETDTASASSYGWRQTAAAAGGGTIPPPATGGGTPRSAAAAQSPPFSPSRGLRVGPGGTGRRGRLALPAPRATAAGRGSPTNRGGAAAAAAARQPASPWESERGAGSAGEARV